MGGFVHLELNTDNVKKAKSFYTKLFGWEATDMEMPSGPYTMLQLRNPGGAMMKKPMEEVPSMWLPYIEVDDVKKTVAAAEKGGGTTVQPYFEVAGFGEGAILIDPTGAAFGIWHSTGAANGNGNNGAQAAATTSKKAGKKKAAKKSAAKKSVAKKAGAKKKSKKKKK